jgi:Cu(I)/Ag(I) efflux system membrane fusion protein
MTGARREATRGDGDGLLPEGGALPEGEERAPAGVGAMSAVRWALVVLMALLAGAAWTRAATRGAAGSAAATARYHCPMHPTVAMDVKGSCPVCGMDLVPVAQGAAPQAHGEAPAAPGGAGQGAYWCPMHPEVASDDPEARCEKCGGMKLLPRERPPRVPGLVPVELSPERSRLLGLRTAPVVRQDLAPELRAVGFVAPDERRLDVVNVRISGWIEQLGAGQSTPHVRKGDVLATVYGTDLRALQQQYINSVRFKPPSGGVAGLQTVVEDARSDLRLLGFADADLDQIARTLQPARVLNLRAPRSGHVLRSTALRGAFVTPGTELFQIADLSSVWVIAEVHESDAARVRVGQEARLTVAAHPQRSFAGRVQYLHPTVNPATRTMQVRVEVANPGLELRPGMAGEVVLRLGARAGLVVPADAIVDTGDARYVIVEREGGRYEPRPVTLGPRTPSAVEIVAGVAEGDRVVTTANFLVDSESRLRSALEVLPDRGDAAAPDR